MIIEKLWRVEDAAEVLNKSKSSIRGMAAKGMFGNAVRRVGGSYRFIPSLLEKWIMEGGAPARRRK